jgi:oligopeptide transport system substrate-binding protein
VRPDTLRRGVPYVLVGLLLAALAWAASLGTLPRADFTFHNGNEVETIDPALATGQPENRIINALFEGLLRHEPPPGWEALAERRELVPLEPRPAMAERMDVSVDGLTYTFHMRKGAVWSNGDPVTAEDFAWSWMRTLHPETGSKYAYQLYYVVGAEAYNLGRVEAGQPVEVELADRPDPRQPFPRGTILRGRLKTIHRPPPPVLPPGASEKQRSDAQAEWKQRWVYAVEVASVEPGSAASAAAASELAGRVHYFCQQLPGPEVASLVPPLPAEGAAGGDARRRATAALTRCQRILPDFAQTVGVRAVSPQTLVVTLRHRTPFFPDLVAFYPLYPVHRGCVERYGSPQWTKPEHIVSNGPFRLEFRRIRDRIRLVKNPRYWDAARVALNVVDALAIRSETTALNMYLDGQLDWVPSYVPAAALPRLVRDYADQFYRAPMLTTYFYRVNVTRPELSDKRVRQALHLAIDKQAICERITQAGEIPAATLVPPGLAGYVPPPSRSFDPHEARRLLAEAGYPGGRGLPPIEILYNDLDAHRTIAEAIQQMWREHLGIRVTLRGLEWGVYLDATHKLDYAVARAGWVADYPDPNTFLDMFMTGNENNQTGWGHERYDTLIRQAAEEADVQRRMALFAEAEAILLDEAPILPIYFYVSKNLVRPRVKGFFSTVQDEHPLKLLRVEEAAAR